MLFLLNKDLKFLLSKQDMQLKDDFIVKEDCISN
jgi:hypothetical protein